MIYVYIYIACLPELRTDHLARAFGQLAGEGDRARPIMTHIIIIIVIIMIVISCTIMFVYYYYHYYYYYYYKLLL